MKRLPVILGILISAVLASIYLYPIFSGLIILPLDLLVSNSGPWHYAGQILLKNPFMLDSIIQMFPWKHLTFSALTSGILPLWNPYQFMGIPFMAAMKPLVFYPANILFVLGEVRAWNMLLWLQLFLSLWFTYLFVTSLGQDWAFALFAGIAYAFNSLMVSVLEFGSEGHVLLWLPILLFFAKRCIDSAKPWSVAGITLATACAIFAGQLQYFAYMSLVVGAFILFYGNARHKPRMTTFLPILGMALGCMIAAVQLVPGMEMFQNSYRGIVGSFATFSQGLLQPYHLIRLLSPDWFGNPTSLDLHSGYIEQSGYFGIIPLFFALYAMVRERKNMYVRFFTIVAIVALLFSMNGIAQILYTLRIPVITSGYGSRIFSMVLFAGAVLSAFGFSAFVNNKSDKYAYRALLYYLGFVAFCFVAGIILARSNSPLGVHMSNIKIQVAGVGIFILAALGYARFGKRFAFSKIAFLFLVLVLTYGDLFRMGYRFLTFSNTKFLYPELPITGFVRKATAADLGRVYGITEPEINTELGVAGTDTYNPLFPMRTATVLTALQRQKDSRTLNNKYELTQNPDMKPALDFLGVSLIVVPKGVNPATKLWNDSSYEKDITRIYESDGSDVYRNNTVLPRFGLYFDVRSNIPDHVALGSLASEGVDFRETVLITEPLSEAFKEGTGSSGLVAAGLNTMKFHAQSSVPAIFYLSDSYDAGWHASVNGKPTTIYHANYNFRAVAVPAGDSEIIFWYLPTSVIIGGIVSTVGVLGTLGFLCIAVFRSKRKPGEIDTRQK